MPVTRTTTAAVQFSLVANADVTLSSSQSSTLQLALTGATNQVTALLARTDRVTLLTNLFGSAGTAPTTFATNLTSLLSSMGSSGLGLRVQVRKASEMNGAMAAYAPNAPGGGVMVYLNADLFSNGTSTDVITYLLLEQYGHALDARLNGTLDSKGDEGKAFATALTGKTLSAAEQAVYGRDPAGGVLNIGGTAVAVESETNAGPGASATALNATFREADGLGGQAAPVAVYSGANVSVGGASEAWQTITALSFTVAGLRDGHAETITIDGTSLTLGAASSGTTTANGLSYSVTLANGVATINLSKAAGLSTSAVNALFNGLTYQNRNADNPTSGTRTITLTSLSDSGGAVGSGTGVSSPNLSSNVTVVAVNDGPTATATASNNTFTEAAGLATQAAAVAVFTGASVNTIEAGQTILGLGFSVSGLKDGSAETLSVDGTRIALGANSSGTTAGSLSGTGLSYGVVVSNGVATLSFSSTNGLTASAANALLNAVSYQNTNRDNPTNGARTITLTSLRDSGGTANGGNDTTNPNLSSTIQVVAVNDAPLLGSLAGVNLIDTASQDLFSATSGTLGASDPEAAALSYGLSGATASNASFDGLNYNFAKAGSYGTLYLNSSTGQYRFQPRSDWQLNALSSSGSESFNLSVSDGSLTSSTSLLINFSGSNEAPEQYVLVDDGAPVLTAEAQALWEQALTNASRYLADLLKDPFRDEILADVFGRAGTDTATFQANLQTLYTTIGGNGLRIDVDLRTDAELNGALAAYAAIGHTGTERIYVNGDKLNSGALDLVTTVSALLEEFGHGMDVRLNGSVDSPGDEGQLFASEVTGVTLTADQRAMIDAENDSATLTIEGVQVLVEEANVTATAGNDTALGFTTGNDKLTITVNTYINSGDTLDALAGTDAIDITATSGVVDFSVATVNNFETLTFNNNKASVSVGASFSGSQIGSGSANGFKAITGTNTGIQVVNISMAGTTLDLSPVIFATWEGQDQLIVNGSTGSDTITISPTAWVGTVSITGGQGVDELIIPGDASSDLKITFSGDTLGIDKLTFGDNGTKKTELTFSGTNFSSLSSSLVVTGNGKTDNKFKVDFSLGGTTADLTNFTFSSWSGAAIEFKGADSFNEFAAASASSTVATKFELGAGADTAVGGAGIDNFKIKSGDTVLSLTGAGNNGSLDYP